MIRLIDTNEIVKVAERAYNAWNLAMATQDTNRGINKVIKRQELCKAVKAVAEVCTEIDPETLPIVQQLRKELEQIRAERDHAVQWLSDLEVCGCCKNTRCRSRDGDEDCVFEWIGIEKGR